MSPLQGLASHGQSVGSLDVFVYIIQGLPSSTQDTTPTLVDGTSGMGIFLLATLNFQPAGIRFSQEPFRRLHLSKHSTWYGLLRQCRSGRVCCTWHQMNVHHSSQIRNVLRTGLGWVRGEGYVILVPLVFKFRSDIGGPQAISFVRVMASERGK